MARNESDREDLLRQATALVERVELSLPGENEPLVVGFRKDGSASFFFGADPVYQFNAAGELRRAYLGGLLYKAERGRLWQMRRERSEGEVVLLSRELDDTEMAAVLQELRARLSQTSAAFDSGCFALVGEVSLGGDVINRIRAWLAALPAGIHIADRPNAG